MRVIKRLNSRYTLHDLITGKENDYHVPDIKPFVFDSALVDPLDVVKKISDHRGKLRHRKSPEYVVSWLGYDEGYNSLEPYTNLCDSDHLHARQE